MYRVAISTPPEEMVRGFVKLSREWEEIRQREVG
jgi:hypothetical protein